MLGKRKGFYPNNNNKNYPLMELLKPSPKLGLNLTFKKKSYKCGGIVAELETTIVMRIIFLNIIGHCLFQTCSLQSHSLPIHFLFNAKDPSCISFPFTTLSSFSPLHLNFLPLVLTLMFVVKDLKSAITLLCVVKD
jgi:hypothetical protein